MFQALIALHVVAMARTKNAARSNPFELPKATLADHIGAIAVTTDRRNSGNQKDVE